MFLEQTTGLLRRDAELLFAIARHLSGDPEPMGHWYKFSHKSQSGYVWMQIKGERARKYPRNSIHVVVAPNDSNRTDQRFGVGQDWWGKEDRHVVVPQGDRVQLALAIELLTQAYWADDHDVP